MSDPERIVEDMEALGQVERRFAATEGERAMLDAVRARLPEAMTSRVEGFVGHIFPLVILGFHGVAILAGGLIGIHWPKIGALICLLTSASLVGEGTGRLGMLRWWLGKVPAYNLVVPAAGEEPRGTVVLSTPLDVPRWRMPRARFLRRPVQFVFLGAMVITALLVLRSLSEEWETPLKALYTVSLSVAAVTGILGFFARRGERSGPADAGGAAVVLELLRRLEADPPDQLAVWTVFTGCGRAHQDGIRAFLSLRGHRLAKPVLVLSLNDVAHAPLQAAVTEGPLWPQHQLPTGPALVERLRWAGVRIPEVDDPEPSDARAAMILGYRALSLRGGAGEASVASARRAAQITETIIRWYAEDLARVASNRPAVEGWAEPQPTSPPSVPERLGEASKGEG